MFYQAMKLIYDAHCCAVLVGKHPAPLNCQSLAVTSQPLPSNFASCAEIREKSRRVPLLGLHL